MKYNIKKRIFQLLLVLAVCTLPLCVWAQTDSAQDVHTLFIKANDAYQNGRYQEAANAYTSILSERENGYLYFNLGNCYLKLNKVGLAVLNYRRAQKYIPRFADLAMNLSYAYEETVDKIEDKSYKPLFKTLFFWYYRLNIKEMLISFVIFNFLFFLVAAAKIFTQNDTVKWLLIFVGVFYILSGTSTAIKLYQDNYQQTGIIIENEVTVRSGSSVSNVALFKLHEGTEVTVGEVKGDWLKISLADGKIGWIQKIGAEII